jgi:hypothetical protein
MRAAIYVHLVAVAVCAAFSLGDSGNLVNRAVSHAFRDYGELLIWPALLAWFACPLVVIFASAGRSVSTRSRTYGILAEFLLCIAQWWMLLPTVQ